MNSNLKCGKLNCQLLSLESEWIEMKQEVSVTGEWIIHVSIFLINLSWIICRELLLTDIQPAVISYAGYQISALLGCGCTMSEKRDLSVKSSHRILIPEIVEFTFSFLLSRSSHIIWVNIDPLKRGLVFYFNYFPYWTLHSWGGFGFGAFFGSCYNS